MKIDVSQLEFIDKKLRVLLVWLEEEMGQEFIITSLYRVDDDGVHGQIPLRGADIRMKNIQVGESIVQYINSKWVYDPARGAFMCAILHGKGPQLHIHLQTHPNTAKRVQAWKRQHRKQKQ